MASTRSSTETVPAASASIAGLKTPHRDPTSVTSFTTAGVRSRLSLDARVDFRTIVPRGLTSLAASEKPEWPPVASTTRSKEWPSSGLMPILVLIPILSRRASLDRCLPKQAISRHDSLSTRAMSCASRPSPTTATLQPGCSCTCSLISKAAASGSTNTACWSLTESGIAWRFLSGRDKSSANAPLRLKIPRTVLSGQWRSSPPLHDPQPPHPTLISPTTLFPARPALRDFSTTPTNSWPRIPR